MGALVESLEDIQESVAAISSTLEGRGIEMSGVPFSGYAAAISGLSQVEVHGNTISQVGGDTFTGASHTKADIDGILQNGSQAAGQAYYRDGTWREAAISGSTVLLGGTFKFIPYVSGRDIHYNATQYISVPEATATAIAYSGDTHTTEDDVQGALDDLFQVSELIDDMAAGGSATAGRLTGMDLYVRQSQSLQGVQVTQAPNMVLAAGAVASAVTAGSGANIYVMPGATATDVTAAGGQVLDSSNVTSYGAVYTATRVFTAGHVDLGCTSTFPFPVTYNGGTSYYLTATGDYVRAAYGGLVSGMVQRRGTTQVSSGGIVKGCVFEGGGMTLGNGATVTGNTVMSNANTTLEIPATVTVCVTGNTFACAVNVRSGASGFSGNIQEYANMSAVAGATVTDQIVRGIGMAIAAPSAGAGAVRGGVISGLRMEERGNLTVHNGGTALAVSADTLWHSGFVYLSSGGCISGFSGGSNTTIQLYGNGIQDWHMAGGEIHIWKSFGVMSGVSSANTRFILEYASNAAIGTGGPTCSDCCGARVFIGASSTLLGGTFAHLDSSNSSSVISGVRFTAISAALTVQVVTQILGCSFTRHSSGTTLLNMAIYGQASGNSYSGKMRATYGNNARASYSIIDETFSDSAEFMLYPPVTATRMSLGSGCRGYIVYPNTHGSARLISCMMSSGSFLHVSSKATTVDTYNSGGTQYVSLGAWANHTTLCSAGLQIVSNGGTATCTTAGQGGSVTLLLGGSAISADILSGGSLLVSSKGVALDVYSAAGATVTSMNGATITYRTVR